MPLMLVKRRTTPRWNILSWQAKREDAGDNLQSEYLGSAKQQAAITKRTPMQIMLTKISLQ